MNYLAHLYLARPTAGGWLGALMPDMVRGRLPEVFGSPCDADIIENIELHRLIDRTTDLHPAFLRARQRLFASQGRFAGVVADVVFDHVLSSGWSNWLDRWPWREAPPRKNSQVLTALPNDVDMFIDTVHRALRIQQGYMPKPMGDVVQRMDQQGWMRDYATPDGLTRVLRMMSMRFAQRFGRSVQLWKAVDVVVAQREAFEADLAELLPALTVVSQQWLRDRG